ncbi:TldD/PmbA family protein [Candidatus Methylacidiphilum infernorum]|uniref:Predicted Zn-dependent protease, modulator of DNA gyrase, PmbA protein n=1 Tax=Methylacidiphilum infernorum (isolate V4) TaxID=481448 RepID=B3DYT9_METI4|nr:metallopeptidase TldD-related protein [Candidatus Methylacidiphilum infernorum]ACD82461.1 Predicted Zn-dependent protease, modulator of DNA gyrase, PmbA protein [Methylacidiphilum infernorum V4]
MILSEPESKDLLGAILSLSKAESLFVEIRGAEATNIRISKNCLNTNGTEKSLKLTLNSAFGNRTASYTLNQLGQKEIEQGLRHCEMLAKVAPPDPEFLPPLGPQTYLQSCSYSEAMGNLSLEDLGRILSRTFDVLSQEKSSRIDISCYAKWQKYFTAIADSNGLFGYQKVANLQLTLTARTDDGQGSGWAGAIGFQLSDIHPEQLLESALNKAILSREKATLSPAPYTVLLEPSAVADLVGLMLFSMDGRAADEGRSVFSKPGGGNRIGELLFSRNVTLISNPSDPRVPGAIFSSEGVPCFNTPWVQNGVLTNLIYSRFWAKKKNKQPLAEPSNIIMGGSSASLEEMIRDIDKAVLITRLWYIREADPQSLIFTGLTRDGTFLIEKGKISRAVNNFRFNQSPVKMLQNVIAMGKPLSAVGSEIDEIPALVPPLLVKDFNFSSLSEAV